LISREGFTLNLAPGYYKNPQDFADSLNKQVEELVAGNPGFKLSFNQQGVSQLLKQSDWAQTQDFK